MTDGSRPILMLARLIIDDLHHADGRTELRVPGGAGLHAAAGAALWWPRVAPVCGVGTDLESITNGLLREDAFEPAGLIVRDARCVRSRLAYLPDGGRTETAAYGAAHFDAMQIAPADIPRVLLPAAATYVFHGTDPAFWSDIAGLRGSLGWLLWELPADAATPDALDAIAARLHQVDIVSLNRAEAAALFGAVSPDEVADRLLAIGARVVVLRLGAAGSLAARTNGRIFVRPPATDVVEETGAGNSFCGGFLASWCLHPGDLGRALRCGVGSAGCTLARVGPARRSQRAAAIAYADAASLVLEDAA